VLSPDTVELYCVDDGSRIERSAEWYAGPIEVAEKGGYPHFMLKEIHEQPAVVGELLHLLNSSPHVDRFLEALRATFDRSGNPGSLYLVGCGTSYHACLLGAYYFNQLAGVAAVPVLGPQFIEQYGKSVGPSDTAVFVSQSGETKDVLNSVKVMRGRGGRVLGVMNVLGSTLMNASDVYLPLACGYEISVPATKTFVNQAVLFLYLAYRLAGRDTAALDALPDQLDLVTKGTEEPARSVSAYLHSWDDLYYLGYGLTHPIALEGALKLKEITYAHCEGIFSSEFKHGPLSAVHDGYPVVFFAAPGDEMMMINHVNEVTVRGGRAITVAAPHSALQSNVHDYLVVPEVDRYLWPILATVPAQLMAYHMSVARGIDPDFPRNLSKTLTVD